MTYGQGPSNAEWGRGVVAGVERWQAARPGETHPDHHPKEPTPPMPATEPTYDAPPAPSGHLAPPAPAGPFDPIARAVAALTRRLYTGDEVRAGMTDPADVDKWIALRRDLAALLDAAKLAAAELDRHIYDVLDVHRHDVLGIGSAERKPGSPSRKGWETDRLLSVIRDRAAVKARAVDTETGEVLATETDALVELIGEVFSLSPKVTGVRSALGVDPDAYCETSPGSPSIKWTWAGDLLPTEGAGETPEAGR